MSFDTVTFWLFFVVAWSAWRLLPFGAAKSVVLLLSLVFYGWWNPYYLPLIALSAVVDHVAAQRMAGSEDPARRRLWLLVSLSTNLGLLGVFKYAPFMAQNATALAGALGSPWELRLEDWVIPVGISFYTFQTMSYSIDVYRRRLQPVDSFRDFFLYVALFPQLVAGPIVRASELLPQLRARRPLRAAAVQKGFEFVVTGLFLKIVVADNLGPAVARVFEAPDLSALSPLQAWVGVACFSTQIFADFAGYSGIAIGLAYLMGLHFPINFNWPYIARGFSEFWTRWHISLSSWLRDYLYVSLGGNRLGRLLTYRNLMLTMLLGGLWHGPAWTFVAWGALHGVALCVERMLAGAGRARRPAAPRGVGGLLTALLQMAWVNVVVMVAWVFFRAQGFDVALQLLGRMFVAPFSEGMGWQHLAEARHLVLVGVVAAMHLGALLGEWLPWRPGRMSRAALVGLWLLLLTVVQRDAIQEFIYFQF